MMFVSTSEKTIHQTKPSARPERSARLIVITLSLWRAPKMRPDIPPSTISKKKPENLLMVGSAIVIPNQCNASGSVRPGVPSVTKLSMASKRPAKSPANSPLRIFVISRSFFYQENKLLKQAKRLLLAPPCKQGESNG